MITLTKEEVQAVIHDLGNMPMSQVENLVMFFRQKAQEAEEVKPEEVKPEDVNPYVTFNEDAKEGA